MKRLSISIQHFDVLREADAIYVDKTESIYHLTQEAGKAYFLSRPRRFGKSLFLSTLKCLYEGRKDLFQGLWIEDKWDWTKTNPVLHFSFLDMPYQGLGLEEAIRQRLLVYYEQFELTPKHNDVKALFQDLLHKIYAAHGKAVVLIDEYDKPLIDYLEQHHLDTARANQKVMKNFYSTLKDSSSMIELLFITGVSKFSKVSLFSDLNYLRDLTMHPLVATTFGYTEPELLHSFKDYLDDFLKTNPSLTSAILLENIKEWYNGYSWDGKTSVYNPYGFLLFLTNKRFDNYWFSSGTPTFLIHKALEQNFYTVENRVTTLAFLEQYSLDNVELTSLFFQTGYLTIKELDIWGNVVLDYPNREVRDSMYQFLMTYMGQRNADSKVTVRYLNKAFMDNDLAQAKEIIQNMFYDLPYDIFQRQGEGLYHGLIHVLFKYVGLDVESEVHTARGRADAIVKTPTHVYIFEFKLNRSPNAAMLQLKERDYASKFRSTGKEIIGIGLNFSQKTKNFGKWIIEKL